MAPPAPCYPCGYTDSNAVSCYDRCRVYSRGHMVSSQHVPSTQSNAPQMLVDSGHHPVYPPNRGPQNKAPGCALDGTDSQLGLRCFFTSLMPLEPPVDTSHLKFSLQAMRPLARTPASGDPTFLLSLCTLNTPGTGLPRGLDPMSPGSPHLTQVTSQAGQCSLLTLYRATPAHTVTP